MTEKSKTPHDSLSKEMLCTVLHDFGEAHPHFEIVAAKPQFADIWFCPGESSSPPPPLMSLLCRMCEAPSILEAYSETPRESKVMDCVTKSLTLMRIRGEKKPPRLWILSPGVPVKSLAAWRARSSGGLWVRGFYSFPEPVNAHVVVLSELPPGPETLILRLLARSPVRDLALVEARATLPSFSKHPIGVVLGRWHVFALQSTSPTPFEQELIMNPELIRLGEEYIKNRTDEAERIAHKSTLVTIYETRFQSVPDEVTMALAQTTDVDTLKRWIPIFTTGSPEQIREAVLG